MLGRSSGSALKNLSESFDELRTNGKQFEMIDEIPFMLRLSKHEAPFFSSLRVILILLILLLVADFGTAARAADESAPHRLPVKIVADQRLEVKTPSGSGMLPLYLSREWNKPQPDVTRAVIIFHGRLRDANVYYRSAREALEAAGGIASTTLLIAPQFLAEADVTAHGLAQNILRWRWGSWVAGEPARAPAAISSFAAVDAVLLRLAERGVFPNLAHVVLAGHSGGAQLVQRYAVVGRADRVLLNAGFKVRYVVANPSSYLYFSADRPTPEGGFAPFKSASCANFNRWKYGWIGAPVYGQESSAAAYEKYYVLREVIYLLGTMDNDPNHPALDKSCAGEAEGPNRYARGLAYVRYLRMRHPEGLNHQIWEVPGIGHDGDKMLTSPCGLVALFDRPGCTASAPRQP